MIPIIGIRISGSDANSADLGHSPFPVPQSATRSAEVTILISHTCLPACLGLDTTSNLEQRMVSKQICSALNTLGGIAHSYSL